MELVAANQQTYDEKSSILSSLQDELSKKESVLNTASDTYDGALNKSISAKDQYDAAVEELKALQDGTALNAAMERLDNAKYNLEIATALFNETSGTLSEAENEKTNAQTEVATASTALTTASNNQTTVKQNCDVAQAVFDKAEAENNRLNNLLTNLYAAEIANDNAASNRDTAYAEMNAAIAAVPVAQQNLEQTKQNQANADTLLAAYEMLDGNDILTNGLPSNPGIPSDSYAVLSNLFATAQELREVAQQSQAEFEPIAAQFAIDSAPYLEAKANYDLAYANYMAAKDAYETELAEEQASLAKVSQAKHAAPGGEVLPQTADNGLGAAGVIAVFGAAALGAGIGARRKMKSE